MLPYKNRLIKKDDFTKTWRQGRSFSEGNLVLKVLENGLIEARIGISVGVRYSPLATVRNRAKRQLREIVTKNLGKFSQKADIIISLKANAGKTRFKELSGNAEKIFLKSHLIKP